MKNFIYQIGFEHVNPGICVPNKYGFIKTGRTTNGYERFNRR